MSDSTTQTTTKTETSNAASNGVTSQTVTPFTEEERLSRPDTGETVGNTPSNRINGATTTRNGKADGVVPEKVGQRIPIPIRPTDSNGAAKSNDTPMSAVEAPTFSDNNRVGRMARAAQASVGNVMTPDYTEDIEESIEDKVNRLRPKTIMMQLRFLYTLFFMVFLFGRLVLWQVYIARLFPDWVNGNNTKRWRKYAQEFRKFALRMGGVQIKAGQFASTRADILPEEVIVELAGLQDKVPTIDFKHIRKVLMKELGKDYTSRYDWIREEPVAAASLGQVHRAKLRDGERVVVKVQRPNVREIIYTDLAAMFIVARIAMRFDFISRRADAELIVDEFGRVLLEEVSYEKEADNARRFQEMFADNEGVYVPHIYSEHSTDKVLTIEDVTSIKLDDFEKLAAAGIDRKDVAERLMDTYMQQIFEDRFFHADPHPGNLFVYPLPVEDETQYIGKGGRPFYLIFIDFGMTGSLTRELVQGLINTLTAVLTRDAKKLVTSYEQLGFLMPNADTKRIEEATTVVFDEVWGLSMTDMRTMDFEVVENIGQEFNDLLYDMPFRVPQNFVYLGRTVSILSGMATSLDPEFNPWVEIQRNVQDLVTTDAENNIFDELGKAFEESFNEIVADGPQGLIRVVERFFQQFQRVNRTEKMLQKLINGDVAVETRMSVQQRRHLERIELQGKRTMRAFIFGSLLITGTLLYTNGDVSLAGVAYGLAGVVAVAILFVRQ